jgi:asparagine synthase (glutamine-hydrolysing)
MMLADARSYLPDDVLVKVDRATMAVGLEGRAPFLDHRVAEFAFQLPTAQKIRGGVGKWLLREVLYRYVPRALIERPKMGFAVPIDAWLRGPLKAWAEDLLDPARLRDEGFFRVEPIQAAWAEHLSGRRNQQHFLWNILMFEAWLRQVGVG